MKTTVTPPKAAKFDTPKLLRTAAELLDCLMESMQSGMDGEGGKLCDVGDICRATTSAAAVAGELRAREKFEAHQRDSFKPEDVLEWLRKQPAEIRLHFVRELHESIEGETSVLA